MHREAGPLGYCFSAQVSTFLLAQGRTRPLPPKESYSARRSSVLRGTVHQGSLQHLLLQQTSLLRKFLRDSRRNRRQNSTTSIIRRPGQLLWGSPPSCLSGQSGLGSCLEASFAEWTPSRCSGVGPQTESCWRLRSGRPTDSAVACAGTALQSAACR